MISRCSRRLLCVAGGALILIGCAGVQGRPWLINRTDRAVEVVSTYPDGHTLRAMLYPEARLPLGAPRSSPSGLVVHGDEEPPQRIAPQELERCLRSGNLWPCEGWLLTPDGLVPIPPRSASPR